MSAKTGRFDAQCIELKTEFAIGRSSGLKDALEICRDVAAANPAMAAMVKIVADRIYAHGVIVNAEAQALHSELGEALGVV